MVDTWARGTVRWYWSADILFWQLSIDHNIDVQLVFYWAPKLESVKVNIGFPVVRTDGRTVTWLPNFLGRVDYHISLAMGLRPRARFARGWSSAMTEESLFLFAPSSRLKKFK